MLEGPMLEGTLERKDQPYKSVAHTLGRMRTLAKKAATMPRIEKIAAAVARPTAQKTARAIHEWIRGRVKYVRDPKGVEQLQSPLATIARGQGDCDAMSVLAASILRAAGYPAAFRAVALREKGQFDHVYVVYAASPEGLTPGRPVALDATVERPPGEDPHLPIAKSQKFVPLSAMRQTSTRSTTGEMGDPASPPGNTTTGNQSGTTGGNTPQWLQALRTLANQAPGIIRAVEGGGGGGGGDVTNPPRRPVYPRPDQGAGKSAGLTSQPVLLGIGALGIAGVTYTVANAGE